MKTHIFDIKNPVYYSHEGRSFAFYPLQDDDAPYSIQYDIPLGEPIPSHIDTYGMELGADTSNTMCLKTNKRMDDVMETLIKSMIVVTEDSFETPLVQYYIPPMNGNSRSYHILHTPKRKFPTVKLKNITKCINY